MQNEYLLLKIDFQSENFVLNDFWKQKMDFLTYDLTFLSRTLSILSWTKNISSEQMDEAKEIFPRSKKAPVCKFGLNFDLNFHQFKFNEIHKNQVVEVHKNQWYLWSSYENELLENNPIKHALLPIVSQRNKVWNFEKKKLSD